MNVIHPVFEVSVTSFKFAVGDWTKKSMMLFLTNHCPGTYAIVDLIYTGCDPTLGHPVYYNEPVDIIFG